MTFKIFYTGIFYVLKCLLLFTDPKGTKSTPISLLHPAYIFLVVDINRVFKTCIYHVYAAIIGNSATQIAGKWAKKGEKINSYDVAFSDASHKNFKK